MLSFFTVLKILVFYSSVFQLTHGQVIVTEKSLVSPQNIKIRSNDYIHSCLVMTGVVPDIDSSGHFLRKLETLLASVLLLSHGVPIHLMILTDPQSLDFIHDSVQKSYYKSLMDRCLLVTEQNKKLKNKLPKLAMEFVSYSSITDHFSTEISAMKLNFNNWNLEYNVSGLDGDGQTVSIGWKMPNRYDKDIFYLTPFYHLVFPIDKIIIMDVDVKFKRSLEFLYRQFVNFSPTALYSFAPDLTPHYFSLTQNWRKENSGSKIGLVGPKQGKNTGVGLFNLARMRRNEHFNSYFTPAKLQNLVTKYSFIGALGHQDWWNILSWENEEFIHHLPCNFNVQVETEFRTGPWLQIFDDYHDCPGPIYIMH